MSCVVRHRSIANQTRDYLCANGLHAAAVAGDERGSPACRLKTNRKGAGGTDRKFGGFHRRGGERGKTANVVKFQACATCGAKQLVQRAAVSALPGAMQQIADWLEQLGMSEYAQRFAENRIDFSVLPDLTDQDLKDLGVVLGDRRKMLRAIGALDTGPAVVAPAAPIVASARATAPMKPAPLEEPLSEQRAAPKLWASAAISP
jgi:hypothetical protein